VLSIRTPEVVTSYLNSGAQAIGKVVGDIEKRFKEKKNNVLIVFFDEIDALSAPRNESNTNQLDTVRAMQSLWLGLTKYESEPQIFFIFNTNHLTLLPATFLDRFKSQRIIKIDKPNKDNRRAQLYGFLHAHGLTRLNRNLFDRHAYEIMQKIGDCEELQQYKQPLQDLQQHLVRIDNAMIQGNALDVMDKLIQHVEDKTAQIDKLLIVERPTNVKLVAEVKQLVATYLRFVSRYLLKIKAQYKNPAKQIAVNIVEHIVEKTEGLSTRGVADIAYIMGEALIKGAPINIELANKAISGAVEKMRFKEQEDNKKLRDERIKDMQLEEAENKKKQRRLENLIGYLRLLAEIRGSCNGTYNAGFMGVGGTQNFLINDILKSYGYSKEDRKTIASQISRSVAIAFAELKSRGKEIAEGK
jgi:SpoVK/Ycf46/Vps4 family AAA+-type ATPase